MKTYLDYLQHVLENGQPKDDRTGVGVLSVFGYQMRFDLRKGFPLVTTKKVHWKSVVHELLWFLSGDTNIGYLNDNGVTIWDEWADEKGDLGQIYGAQWRRWPSHDGGTIDQLANVLERLKTEPNSRQLMVSTWNIADFPHMKFYPCHMLYQFFVNDGALSCMMTIRSSDGFLGLPFNIASYALLTHMVAEQCGYSVGELVISIGDGHIYNNHIEQVKTQLQRDPLPLPKLKLGPCDSLFDYRFEDIHLEGYESHARIAAKVAV